MDERHSSETDQAAEDPLDQLVQRIGAEVAHPDISPRRQAFLKILIDKIDLISLANGNGPVLDPEHSELDATIAELRNFSESGNAVDRRVELLARLNRLVQQILEPDELT